MKRRGFIASLIVLPLTQASLKIAEKLVLEPKDSFIPDTPKEPDYIIGRGVLYFSELNKEGRPKGFRFCPTPTLENALTWRVV